MPSVPPLPLELWNQIPPAAQPAILALVQRYEQRLQELHKQVAELQQRLNQSSTTSSKPPMLGWWKRVRDGTLTKVRFAGRLYAERNFRVRFRAVLARGSVCGCAKTAGTCRDLLTRSIVAKLQFSDLIVPISGIAWKNLKRKELAKQLP